MANPYVAYTGDGSTTLFTVTFPYLSTSHVYAYVDGVETSYTWNGSQVQFSPAPALGTTITIKRITPTTPLVDWQDASVVTESNLDTVNLQNLYLVEEASLTSALALQLDATDDTYNAASKIVKNVATPVNDNDAVNKAYLTQGVYDSIAADFSVDRTVTKHTVVNGQSEYSVNYAVGHIDVFLNGSLLDPTDYTATNGTSIVLAESTKTDDTLTTIVWSLYDLTNNVSLIALTQAEYDAITPTQGTLYIITA